MPNPWMLMFDSFAISASGAIGWLNLVLESGGLPYMILCRISVVDGSACGRMKGKIIGAVQLAMAISCS